MAKAETRILIQLSCSECKERNYNTVKSKKNDPNRVEFNKYCPKCRKHTMHKEVK
jgi:large subunit ribosomal protein L33